MSVTIDPEIEEQLSAYLSVGTFQKYVRIRCLGIGCMGAVFDLVPDVPGENDEMYPVFEYVFIANRKQADRFGGYIFKKTRSGFRIKTQNHITGGCASCYNTKIGKGCH